MATLGGPILYEVVCPRCAHVSEVAEDAVTMRCAACALESDLISEEQAAGLGIDPEQGALPDGVEAWAAPPAEDLEEIPCPACSAPILVAADEHEGYCPHCAAELEFEHVDDADGTDDADDDGDDGEDDDPSPPAPESFEPVGETRSVPDAPAPEDPHPEVHEKAAAGPATPAFDPELKITTDNAPLIECAPVEAAEQAEAATPGHARRMGDEAPLHEDVPGDEDDEVEADKAVGDDVAEEASEEEPAKADVPDGPAPADRHRAVREGAPAQTATPAFDPTLEVTPANAPLVECATVTPAGPDRASQPAAGTAVADDMLLKTKPDHADAQGEAVADVVARTDRPKTRASDSTDASDDLEEIPIKISPRS